MLSEEDQGIAGLILSTGRHQTLDGKVLEKGPHLSVPHPTRVCIANKRKIPGYPAFIRLLRAYRVASAPNLRPQRVKPCRRCIPNPGKTRPARLLVFCVAPNRCWSGLTRNGGMVHWQGTRGRLPIGPIKLLSPCDLTHDEYMLESINRLAILPVCHAAYSAQFLQVIGHILRGMVRKPCVHKGLEIVLRSDDIPAGGSRLHAF